MIPQTHRRGEEDFGDPVETKAIKAGRRTYFIDVRATRDNDYFLTITESRKKTHADGTATFDRHKIFLYKEDFAKFQEGLSEVVEFVKREKPSYFENQEDDDNNYQYQY